MTPSCIRAHVGTLAVLVALLVLAGCAASDAAAVTTIDADEAVTLAGSDDVVVIDVRTPDEYDAGHLEGAELLDLSGGEFAQRIGSYDRDTTYVLYCRTGNRSAQAAALMDELGFTDVRDAGAYDDLAAAGAATNG